MKSLSASSIKQSIGAVFLLLASIGSQDSYASVAWTAWNPPPTPPTIGVVYQPFYMILPPDGSWTAGQLPILQVGQQYSLSTSSTSFDFYLGNSLNGTFDVSLTPAVTDGVQLFADIANRSSILSKTNAGVSTFEANSGNDYYLLLDGAMIVGQTYQLQVSQALPSAIPVPATVWLFASGLMGLTGLARKRKAD